MAVLRESFMNCWFGEQLEQGREEASIVREENYPVCMHQLEAFNGCIQRELSLGMQDHGSYIEIMGK